MRKLLLSMVVAFVSVPAIAAEGSPLNSSTSIQIAGPVLMVTDLERSLKFYVDGLGLQASTRLPGNPGPGVIVVAPGQSRQRSCCSGKARRIPSDLRPSCMATPSAA